MKQFKVYDKNNRIIFNKNNKFYFIYKYEEGKEIRLTFSNLANKTKYHSILDYKESTKEQTLTFSISENHVEYQIVKNIEQNSKEIDNGRIPFSSSKKEWSKKTLMLPGGEMIGVEEFNGERSVIYKIKEDILNKLINKTI